MDHIKPQLINLWRTSFNDSETFIQLFFDRVYKPENVLYREKEGRIISALHMLPYTMTFYGKEISVCYIYAACTHPSERGNGYMHQLIQQAFQVMEQRKVALTVIIPAEPSLFDYYRSLGYTEAFDYSEMCYIRPLENVEESNLLVVPPEVPSLKSLYQFFDQKQRERSCYILHTYEDFITILRDLQESGGQMLTALDPKEKVVGMIFFYSNPEHLYVKELFYEDLSIKQLLLQEATLQNNVSKALYRTPAIGINNHRLGMARIIDRHRLIHLWSSTHANSSFNQEQFKEMDTPSLTQLLLGYPSQEAYMSLMLD